MASMIIPLRRSAGAKKGLIKSLREDSARYEDPWKDPAYWTMAVYRFGRWAMEARAPVKPMASKVYGGLRLALELVTHNTIHREAKIGEGFTLLHGGSVHIHPGSVIGERVTIMHEVTLGTNTNPQRTDNGAPVIGDDVFIGAGAKILGPVRIGDGAVIAANSLVLADVPAGATAAGVPARILRFNGRDQAS